MKLLDVNVLLYAHREEMPLHPRAAAILQSLLDGPDAFAISDLILSGFVRVACHSKTFRPPSPIKRAIAFAESIRSAPNAVRVMPGDAHWPLFIENLSQRGVKGEDAWDAYLAALAMEADCEWVSFDQGFSRYPGLRWVNALRS